MLSQVALFNKGPWPNGRQQFILGDYLLGMLDKVQKQIEGFGIQRNLLPISRQRTGCGVNVTSVESE
jgi:hypothetical protein